MEVDGVMRREQLGGGGGDGGSDNGSCRRRGVVGLRGDEKGGDAGAREDILFCKAMGPGIVGLILVEMTTEMCESL